MNTDVDISIIGSGFAGSLMALICRRLGRSVVLLEKGSHPRFAIGESSTPLANLLLEDLANRYDLPRIAPLAKWGSWQRAYPGVACGLKRGFSFFHHRFGERFTGERVDQLLVAASPHDEIADTHWYRPDFDHFLVTEAERTGVDYRDHVALENVSFEGGTAALTGSHADRPFRVKARFVIDASGPRGFLHHALDLGEVPFADFPGTQALLSHFTGVGELAPIVMDEGGEVPPFPVDAAAVHHVFPGGWIWVLRFNNGVTSAGVAATDSLARELGLAEGQAGWERLLRRLPTVAEQFADSRPQIQFHYSPRLPFRSRLIANDQWALLPSAAGFVDPLLSTGFPLTLLGISRLAEVLERDWDSPRFASALTRYQFQTAGELDASARLVGALYANLDHFPVFAALTRVYFAAASFSECARRLGRADLAGSFLMHDVPGFGPACRTLLARATRRPNRDDAELISDIYRFIEPFDVAGLGDGRRQNWHPADASDLLRRPGKIGATTEEIEAMLTRCGFAVPQRAGVE